MQFNIPRIVRFVLPRFPALLAAILIFTTYVCAQEPALPKAKSSPEPAAQAPAPTFDSLLTADTYKLYGEVRNLGQLLSTGGAGEIVDPIMKLADPPAEFKSIVKFLKANSEALASSRLLFATWPARANVPNVFVAIEFGTPEEATRFAPKLETFLPTVLPSVPVESEEKPKDGKQQKPSESGEQPAAENSKDKPGGYNPAAPPKPDRLPFVINHSGSLVFISDKPFKLEKIHPPNTKLLAEDQNFRVAHDRFSSEPIFVFFNVALEERSRRQQSASAIASSEEQTNEPTKQQQAQREDESAATEARVQPAAMPSETTVTLEALPQSTPEPEPSPATQAQQAQTVATNQAGRMLDFIGLGEPQWPEAIGLALVLDNNEYVIRAILIDAPNAKRLPIPFIPQLISGPPVAADVSSVLPDDTEVFASASIDLGQTYEGMRKQADAKAKSQEAMLRRVQRQGPGPDDPSLDPFVEFEKKAGFKIKEDLLPVLGNEIAIAGTLNALQGTAGFNLGIRTSSSIAASEPGTDKDKKERTNSFPILLIAVKDRDAASRLLPRVLNGLGIGQANLLARRERRGDAEMVSYADMFAYAFVGDFLLISDAATVRHVVDANTNHQTLSSNSTYRNSSRWESRQNLGQIYISPALMEAYQQDLHKQAATMDPAMRDFLMKLTPESGAITYALSNDGLGSLHELHLPKNLIITAVAGISSTTKNPPPEMNEAIAMGMLQTIAGAELSYKINAGDGGYGGLDQLIDQKLVT